MVILEFYSGFTGVFAFALSRFLAGWRPRVSPEALGSTTKKGEGLPQDMDVLDKGTPEEMSRGTRRQHCVWGIQDPGQRLGPKVGHMPLNRNRILKGKPRITPSLPGIAPGLDLAPEITGPGTGKPGIEENFFLATGSLSEKPCLGPKLG